MFDKFSDSLIGWQVINHDSCPNSNEDYFDSFQTGNDD